MHEHIESIVVGFDDSPMARVALEWAAEQARLGNAKLQVLVALGGGPRTTATRVYADRMRWAAEEAERRLSASDLTGWEVVRRSGEGRAVLAAASRPDNLVVVGSAGHGPIGGAVLGSVSQHLLRHAAGPVVVVRQPNPVNRGVVVGVDGSPGSERALAFGTAIAGLTGHDVRPLRCAPPDDLVTALDDASASAALVVLGTSGPVGRHLLRHAKCPVAVVPYAGAGSKPS